MTYCYPWARATTQTVVPMPPSNMPGAEVAVDVELARALVAAQFPALAELSITPVAHGWDNVVFRLGEALSIRLPRRSAGAVLIEHEQRWLPELAARLPLPVPAPVHVGVPADGYPWRWSICPWLDGEPAALSPPHDLFDAARRLAAFLQALHHPAPADAPDNPVRGVPVAARHESWVAALRSLGDDVGTDQILVLWDRALAAPVWNRRPVWIHGDLHPANVLVDGGRLSAVIDFGDIAKGDPASDLASAWMLLDSSARRVLRELTSYDDATWVRAHAWAAGLGVVMLANSADNAVIHTIGERALAAALADLAEP
ncbi:MAG TPA: aminoglycoside phosphotransferase family protein [Acidimicrobiales bacterium]|jgi:aminoglycoside phosphotransferase (APT) family kinase protein|nr:aminoglycoside phosphotransferase family protein [Acidimicrobiales bacterium]